MKTIEQAEELAHSMIETAEGLGVKLGSTVLDGKPNWDNDLKCLGNTRVNRHFER